MNTQLKEIVDLFMESFAEDTYFNARYSIDELREICIESLSYCIDKGCLMTIYDKNKLTAFLVAANKKDISEDMLYKIYPDEYLRTEVLNMPEDTILMVSMAVAKEYRGRRIATNLVKALIDTYKDSNMIGDISSKYSMPIYERLGFEISEIEPDYYLVKRYNKR